MLEKFKEDALLKYKKAMNKINLAKLIINGVFQLFFLLYYVYLIVTHINSLGYVICYSILLGVLLIAFAIDIILKDKVEDTKEEKKSKKNKKKRYRTFVKIVRYLIKFATICIAFQDVIIHGGTPNAILLLSFSIAVFILQIAFATIVFSIKRSIAKTFFSFSDKFKRRTIKEDNPDVIDYEDIESK